MSHWTLHWLEATCSLSPYRDQITENFVRAEALLTSMMPSPRLDILIQNLPGQVIPEAGLLGRAFTDKLFSLSVDPDNPAFEESLHQGTMQRHILHEVHHCLRMAGPGYGLTAGEALVSEGLAGQFVRQLADSSPEIWEVALSEAQLLQWPLPSEVMNQQPYDHAALFFGSGTLPRWYGYSLGYQMVAAWQSLSGTPDPQQWINVPAARVIAAAQQAGLVTA